MTPQQLKKLERLAKVLDNGDVELLAQLDQLETKTEKEIQAIYKLVMEALSVAEQTKKLEGKKGEPGYTPVKEKDYFDGEKGDPGYTPVKGVDYFDGEDGYTPVKGKDYFDGEDGYAPIKGVDYFDGEKGDPGADGFIDEATISYLEEELKRIDKKNGGYGQVVRKLRAGNNIVIDETNMEYPTISVDPQITVSDTAPTAPATNDIWIDTNAYTYRAVTSTYTITLEDYLLDCSGTFTITLPTAVGFTGEYIIKNSGDGVVTVNTTSAQTIDDYTSGTLTLVYQDSLVIRSNTTGWVLI